MLERISVSPNICHGKPCIKGTRIMVWQILDLLSAGVSPEKIASEEYFADITPEDVKACIAFAKQLVKSEEIHFFEELKEIILTQ